MHDECSDPNCKVWRCKVLYWQAHGTPALKYGNGGSTKAEAQANWRGPSIAAQEKAIVAAAAAKGMDIGRPPS